MDELFVPRWLVFIVGNFFYARVYGLRIIRIYIYYIIAPRADLYFPRANILTTTAHMHST